MVAFLAQCELDISLITFHGFKEGTDTLLARQVEVQAQPAGGTVKSTKDREPSEAGEAHHGVGHKAGVRGVSGGSPKRFRAVRLPVAQRNGLHVLATRVLGDRRTDEPRVHISLCA
jgi:hypothetical protein